MLWRTSCVSAVCNLCILCVLLPYITFSIWTCYVFQWTYSSCSLPDPGTEQFCHREWWRRFTNHHNLTIDGWCCDENRPSQGSCYVSQGQHCGGCTRLGSGGHLGSPIFLFLRNFSLFNSVVLFYFFLHFTDLIIYVLIYLDTVFRQLLSRIMCLITFSSKDLAASAEQTIYCTWISLNKSIDLGTASKN
jgi:hypothetical protein